MAKRSLQLTEQMKCATDNPADPILKFSEIFLAPAERPIFLRRKKGMRLSHVWDRSLVRSFVRLFFFPFFLVLLILTFFFALA
jgi:hypothetical protein